MFMAVMGTYGGDTPVANTLWVRNGSALVPSLGDFDATVQWVGDKFVSHFKIHTINAMTWTNIDAYYYDASGILLATQRVLTGSGTRTGLALPANVSVCVGWQVQQHYKGGHPRTYLVGPAPDELAGGRRYTPAYVAAVTLAANQFHSDVNVFSSGNIGSLHLGVVSFFHNKLPRDPAVFRDFVPGGAHCDARVDSQRRRLGRDIPP